MHNATPRVLSSSFHTRHSRPNFANSFPPPAESPIIGAFVRLMFPTQPRERKDAQIYLAWVEPEEAIYNIWVSGVASGFAPKSELHYSSVFPFCFEIQ